MSSPHATLDLPRPLGDGLVLRLATPADTEALGVFNNLIHLEEGEPADFFIHWTRALMSGQHPTTSAADFVVVEDTAAGGAIVSAACLIPQVWAYDGIPFPVGRPELVGTDPAYRGRGLVRAIFDELHALSAAYGHLAQGITGILWFYRQFGYEYALALGGARDLRLADVPALEEGEAEPYHTRPATTADIPELMRLYEGAHAGKLVTAPFDEARWRYELAGRTYASRTLCLLDDQGAVVGYCAVSPHVWRSHAVLWALAVNDGVSIRAVLPTVFRALKAQGEAYLAERRNGTEPAAELAGVRLALGPNHPAYAAFDSRLGPPAKPYSWYVRVPDLPGFLRHIAPALERRLVGSVMAGYSGDLKLWFFRDGLRLVFDQGRLAGIEDWQAPELNRNGEGASFPPLVFLQLLFGFRSLAELSHAFPDCRANEEQALLLDALFPRRESQVVALA